MALQGAGTEALAGKPTAGLAGAFAAEADWSVFQTKSKSVDPQVKMPSEPTDPFFWSIETRVFSAVFVPSEIISKLKTVDGHNIHDFIEQYNKERTYERERCFIPKDVHVQRTLCTEICYKN